MDVVIRSYRPDDLATVHAINQAEVPAVGSESSEALAHIASESCVALTVEVNDTDDERAPLTIAGFTFVLPPKANYDSLNYAWFGERYQEFIYLDRIAIAPPYQRRGIGRMVYDEVEQRGAQEWPTARIFALEVNLEPRNDVSLAFHTGLGFLEVGQRRGDDGKLVSMMIKPLG